MGCANGAPKSPTANREPKRVSFAGTVAAESEDNTLLAAPDPEEEVAMSKKARAARAGCGEEEDAELNRKRALAQLSRLFNGVDSQKNGKISLVALTASLEHDESTLALVREAGVNDSFYLANELCKADAASITWEHFIMYLDKAIAAEAVGIRTIHQLKVIFRGLPTSRKGRVGTKRIARALRKDTEDITDLADMLEQAGFCPYLTVLENLDREPGNITWQEFLEKYVCCQVVPSTPQERELSLRSSDTSHSSHLSGRSSLQASESASDGEEAVVVREWQEPKCLEVCCAASPKKLQPLAI